VVKTYAEFLSHSRYEVCGGMLTLPGAQAGTGIDAAEGDPSADAASGGTLAALNKSVQNKSSLNKNKNKNKNKIKNKNKNKNKNKMMLDAIPSLGSLLPSLELRRLHQLPATHPFTVAKQFAWECLDLQLPPGPDVSRLETAVLLSMQARDRERARRAPDIEAQAALSVDEFLRPLGIEGLAGYPETESLFLNILTACEYVGLIYKAKFDRDRPSLVEPRLRPLLPVPAHAAYPSNHSFQCHSIAYLFNMILPEHAATEELARIALSVAENREWAGLHYPSDTAVGRDLARRFAPYLRDAFAASCLAVQQEWT
jgi:hypothetical protein